MRIGYPKELMFKIEERRAKCYLALENHAQAIISFRKTLSALDEAKLTLERKKKIESDVRVMLTLMEKGNQLASKKNSKNQQQRIMEIKKNALNNDSRKTVPRIEEINPLYPSCSKSVEIRHGGSSVGRYAVATKDISPGEILVVEKPHSAFLLGEYRFTKISSPSINGYLSIFSLLMSNLNVIVIYRK